MLHKSCSFFILISLTLHLEASLVLGIENESSSANTNDLQKILLDLQRNLKNEISDINKSLKDEMMESINQVTDFLRAQLLLQRDELFQLKDKFENMHQEFKTFKENFEQNDSVKGMLEKIPTLDTAIKDHCTNQVQKYDQLMATITNGFQQQHDKLTSSMTQNANKQEVIWKWDENFNCTKDCGPFEELPKNCAEAMSKSFQMADGTYLLNLPNSGLKPFYVYCSIVDNEIWTVIQRRQDGSVNFNRNWHDYKHGFGNLYGEFWLGLERLHALTTQSKHELKIWLEDKRGEKRFARYKLFSIASEMDKYRLRVGDYSGNANDDLNYYDPENRAMHNGMQFSTSDNCNDNHRAHEKCCATSYKGGWWFNRCYRSHLNGPYNSEKDGIDWNDFAERLTYSKMAIRQI